MGLLSWIRWNVEARLYQAWLLVYVSLRMIIAFFRGAQWQAQPYRPSGRERDRRLLDELKEDPS